MTPMRIRAKSVALIAFAFLLNLGHAYAVSKPPCAPAGDKADWRVYSDTRHHFCFLYPKTYVQAPDTKDSQGVETLHSPDVDILVGCCNEEFDLQALVRSAPTGVEFPPEPFVAGSNKFYYYGPGGSGISYPDQFFYDLRGKTLSIDFDGGYEDGRTPSDKIKLLERQVLATFRTY
jgi:hypothetical protein